MAHEIGLPKNDLPPPPGLGLLYLFIFDFLLETMEHRLSGIWSEYCKICDKWCLEGANRPGF